MKEVASSGGPTLPEGKRRSFRLFGEFFAFWGILYMPALLLSSFSSNSSLSYWEWMGFASSHFTFYVLTLPFLLLLFYLRRNDPQEWVSLLERLRLSFGVPFLALPMALLLAFVSFGIHFFWGGGEAIGSFRGIPLPLLSVPTLLLVGYTEELFFRYYAVHRFWRICGSWGRSILVANLFFAAGHWSQGVRGLVTAFVLGIFLSLILHRYRSLHLVAITHALYNFQALAWGSVGSV